ncbi:hypothetical protein CAPTEDRAFT_202515 [Capitella teleta]|uniref:Uncharacterized protein n=1 Tax=Capitella teleta TaxID=283909 RepID=R7U568_CAPTE|nr:hypothetical protein CAPTEDRAFT_202515 [Capitella teleta]|eukprot:ELU01271.1 hypothetical protein CAPTEDRAFT_202515 [Capitella teleta]
MVINKTDVDHQPIIDGSLEINNCDTYNYLGSIFSQSSKFNTSIKAQCHAELTHAVKFKSSIRKNSDLPFAVEMKMIKTTQKKCLKKLAQEREGMVNDSFMHALSRYDGTPCGQYVTTIGTYNPGEEKRILHNRIHRSERTKYRTYVKINPDLTLHAMNTDRAVKEHERIAVVKSHNLAMKKGRWTRRPREERLCQCGEIQDEIHIISRCTMTRK